jgi:cbb3-type cytochrome oxidase cytochrome c subunit
MNRGPDLSHIGQDPAHTVAWFTKLIRNPKSVKAGARMPAFDRLSQADLKALAEYLESLK